ncbi:hypothetical protein [Pantoea cypripedii]|uniref:Uncharacterized protein n=1 Tax=Pantoea cypripedii TaxID=55209 RepID=A0A6B9GI19_PANCY|nr:hypothetical protein [Pantoea cypripedii]QGY33176.1 hypothetical protein CUN67_30150 [Pantoea cypripedii]
MHHLLEMLADLISNIPLIRGIKKDKKSVRNRIADLEYKPVCRISVDKNNLPEEHLPNAE